MRNQRISWWYRVIAGVMVMGALVLGLVACGNDSDDEPSGPGDHGQSLPDGSGPQPGGSPDESVQEALSRIYSWEPVRDVNSGAGMKRALPWLSGEMRSVAEREDIGNDAMRPMKQWDIWRQEKAIIGATVKVVPQLDEADSSSVIREATVLQEVQRADGSVDPLSLVTYEVDVARDKDECWRVWRITVLHHQPLSDGVIQ